jgi:hypothetical protein
MIEDVAAFLSRRDVAQPGRALAWGARGRQFKSARPDQSPLPIVVSIGIPLPLRGIGISVVTQAASLPGFGSGAV